MSGDLHVAVVSQVDPLVVRLKGATTDVDVQDATVPVPADLTPGDRVLVAIVDRMVTFMGKRGAVAPSTHLSVPLGGIMPWGADETLAPAAPAGWLKCNGDAVSRETYAELYALVGDLWGAGDGVTTFNVPDLRGRTVIGAGTGTGLTNRNRGDTVGAETHTLVDAEIPAHTHGSEPAHRHAPDNGGQFVTNTYPTGTSRHGGTTAGYLQMDGGGQTELGGAHTHDSVGGNGAHNNMQPSTAMLYIIRATTGA